MALSHFLATLFLLHFAVGGSHASVPTELVYWKSLLPDTPIPKTLQDLLLQSVNKNALVEMLNVHDDKDIGILRRNTIYFGYDYFSGKPVDAAETANKTIYFLEKDLHPGKKVKLAQLTKPADTIAFLPNQDAVSVPFSTDKFPEILDHFSVQPKSVEASIMKETIQACEVPAMLGEEKYCATSFESLVDWSVSERGKNVHVLSNEVEKETKNRDFTIEKGLKSMEEKQIVCHKMKYPYAVFLCHSIYKSVVYEVPLVGAESGIRAKAVAVCHKDTSAWNPKHLAFQILKVRPGSVPICHFLARETLVWVPNN